MFHSVECKRLNKEENAVVSKKHFLVKQMYDFEIKKQTPLTPKGEFYSTNIVKKAHFIFEVSFTVIKTKSSFRG